MITASPDHPPRHAPSQWTLVLVLAVLLVPFVWTSAFFEDEFTLLSDGLRLRHGELMYRDFFQFIGPVTHWLAALAFLPAGPSLIAARVFAALSMVLTGWQLYAVGRRLALPPWVATLPPVILVVALFRLYPGFNHHWLVLPFLLGGLLAAMRGLEADRRRWWGLAGAAACLATLTVQTDGLVLTALLGGFIMLQPAFSGWTWRRLGRALSAFAVGFLTPLLLVGGYFAAQGALGALWYHLWEWPLAQYKRPGGLNDAHFAMDLPSLVANYGTWINRPFWYARTFYLVFPSAVHLAAVAVAVTWLCGMSWRRLRHRRGWSAAEARFALLCLVVVAALFLALKGRADLTHVGMYAWAPVLLATVLAQAARDRMKAPEWVLARWLPLSLLLAFAASGAAVQAQRMVLEPASWLSLATPDERLQKRPVLAYLRERMRPEEHLAAMPFPGTYFFYAGRPATRYTLIFHPKANYNTEAEYREHWEQILIRRPRFVVFNPGDGERGLSAYMPWPLPGYREATRLKREPKDRWPAVVFERVDPQ